MARFRAASFLALAAGIAVGAGGVGAELVACAAFSEAAAESGVADGAFDAGADGTSGDAGVCASGAFCDSFDDDRPLPRAWNQVAMRGTGSLAVVRGAGVNDSGALVATFAAAGTAETAYLTFNAGTNGPASYTVVLAFSAQALPNGTNFLLGPRFFADNGPNMRSDVIVDFHAGNTRLDKETPTCDGGCGISQKDSPIGTAWHRYVVTLVVRPGSGSDYGDIRFDVDGTPVSDDTIAFPLSSPKSYGFQVGLTYSSGKTSGSIAFDDVSLQITP